MDKENRPGSLDILLANSTFQYLGPPPEFILTNLQHLSAILDRRPNHVSLLGQRHFMLGRNLIRRLGDLRWFEFELADVLSSRDRTKAAILGSTFMIAYMSAAKACLDAVAITIAFTAPVAVASPKHRDFGNKKFWQSLHEVSEPLNAELEQYKTFMRDVIRWRDAAVHRLGPVLVPHTASTGDDVEMAGAIPPEAEIKMISQIDQDLTARTVEWLDPLFLTAEWTLKLDRLVEIGIREVMIHAARTLIKQHE